MNYDFEELRRNYAKEIARKPRKKIVWLNVAKGVGVGLLVCATSFCILAKLANAFPSSYPSPGSFHSIVNNIVLFAFFLCAGLYEGIKEYSFWTKYDACSLDEQYHMLLKRKQKEDEELRKKEEKRREAEERKREVAEKKAEQKAWDEVYSKSTPLQRAMMEQRKREHERFERMSPQEQMKKLEHDKKVIEIKQRYRPY